MIVVLYQSECQNEASQTAENLSNAFNGHVQVALVEADSAQSWPASPSWDDLLIVMYRTAELHSAGNNFIEEYLKQRPDSAMLLPVAVNTTMKKPPDAAASIKALEYDEAAKGPNGRLVNRVGGMLNLRLVKRENKIFISYRALDGAKIAAQLHTHLTSMGYIAWLDEAKEVDGETTILPGSPVQQQIDQALEDASLVLLIDTPAAPESPWIKHEVDTANALLLPILPLCFRDAGDQKQGPRFRALLALQRWVQLTNPDTAENPLSDSDLDRIVSDAEQYLCEIFRRKCRVPSLVKSEFLSQGFEWNERDKSLLMFEASKTHSARLKTNVLSHCSIFDQIYNPALKRFGSYLTTAPKYNHSLFIYDGDLLSESQLQEIDAVEDDTVIVLHHQELAALIGSNFTKLIAS